MNTYTPGSRKMPEPKRTPRKGGGLTVSMKMLRDGECKFVSTQSIAKPSKRASACAALHTTARNLGFEITTYTSVDNRIVARLKGGAA